ncbi:hypothetical protein [Campylobacter helveticus]|uniref:hypothetical protein n=1 Tax=Campylobacter helveticus TaxID=28898 RepID=UPI001112A484|nr:hypothetical protein [Campylobacter helveticus]MCR2062561.1 hypothetical protein [Campylobacter helveticus]TNB54461.1 hypothetical protein FDW47_07730 [Campylobacter helveticus]TNB57361.1 hypothetical protein FDW44_07165 [Campylobacter helveticus]TNB61104.1 hypothetical protein FDW43_09220 [Campylobacter helveticus]
MLEIEITIDEFCSIFNIKINQYYSKRFNTFLPIRHKKISGKYQKVILAKIDVVKNEIIFKTKNNNIFFKKL